MEDIIIALYSIIPFVIMMSYLPQIISLFKATTEEVRGISLSSWFIWVSTGFITLLYATFIMHDARFIFVSAVGFGCCAIITMLILIKRRRCKIPVVLAETTEHIAQ
ncbi:MAG: hypothetical protein GC136_07420 [Alphaproteobacteria bacterium]|nr:hypothetical protein [Alphaproteobacteria bacterium]